MQISLPQRIAFQTISPADQERENRKLLAQYSWRVPRGIFRFFISGMVAFFLAMMSLFSWNSSVKDFTLPYLATEGSAQIGTGEDFHEFSSYEKLSSGMTLKTDKASRFSLLVFGKNIVRLDRNTTVVVQSFSPDSRDGVFLDLDLQKGSLWINTTMSGNSIPVKVGELEISVSNAVSLISREEGTLFAYVDRHAVSGKIGTSQFLVPQGMQFAIRESEIPGKIDQLRYSKFKKEFFRLLPEKTIENDEWMTFNRQKDGLVLKDAVNLLVSEIADRKFFTFKEASTL
ncbi:hypothetical protein HZA41_00285, partial [Candidatus Peregrinibacteria bacterium]|nr:hypothetical protein [Candidatus Peregrinibacteria bacterium]